jgi:hypothetical protein
VLALPVFWQVVVRIRPPCRVDEEDAGEDGRGPEACVRKTAINSVAIHGQDFTFDAVADAVSTQVSLGEILRPVLVLFSLRLGILWTDTIGLSSTFGLQMWMCYLVNDLFK